MSLRNNKKISGFTLVELTIVLGIVGLMMGGLWRMMSGNNTQMRDQVTAAQHAQLIKAVDGYLRTDEGQNFMMAMAGNAVAPILPPMFQANAAGSGTCPTVGMPATPGLCNFLPSGFWFNTTNPYGQTFAIGVRKDGQAAGTRPNTYSFMIASVGGTEVISDTSGGRISTAIGADGGFVYSDTAPAATGSYGTWTVSNPALATPTTGYGIAGAGAGHVASLTRYFPSASFNYNWLSRMPIAGDANDIENTMMTDLFMEPTGGGAGNELNLRSNSRILGQSIAAGQTPEINISSLVAGADNVNAHPLISLAASRNCVALGAACGNYALSISRGDLTLTDGVIHGTTFTYAVSDIRLKKDIKPLSGSLDNIMKLNPVSFVYKKNGNPSMGLIAQELEKVYPQLVLGRGDVMKSVAYEGLIGPILASVQELKKSNDALMAKQKDMEKELESLKKAKSE